MNADRMREIIEWAQRLSNPNVKETQLSYLIINHPEIEAMFESEAKSSIQSDIESIVSDYGITPTQGMEAYNRSQRTSIIDGVKYLRKVFGLNINNAKECIDRLAILVEHTNKESKGATK